MMATIEQCRRFFAEHVVGVAGSADARLIDAFAAVARERFVGPGPWELCVGQSYLRTPDADPRWLYQDVVVALDRDAGLNNGQPTLHARCFDAAQVERGQTVVHVGAGSGYYTALLAHLVEPDGKVVAFEIHEALARRAQANLAACAQVELRAASAVDAPLPCCEVIYVSAGVTDPPPSWLDALRIGGRLVLPLTTDTGEGVMLVVTRSGGNHYAARALLRVGFVACVGARCAATSRSLAAALQRDSIGRIRSLRRDGAPDASAWCRGDGWWLSSADAG
jgi:protein-L-isoaspartate(D-aspartate) O-methyltransferase